MKLRVCVCVCVQRASMWVCETSNWPLFTKCPAFSETAAYSTFHSWVFLSLSFFLRPDNLNLTVIRLISPFSCCYCLPGSAARQPYLCLQQPETKSFSSPVISSLGALHSRDAAGVKPVMQGCKTRCGVQAAVKKSRLLPDF